MSRLRRETSQQTKGQKICDVFTVHILIQVGGFYKRYVNVGLSIRVRRKEVLRRKSEIRAPPVGTALVDFIMELLQLGFYVKVF